MMAGLRLGPPTPGGITQSAFGGVSPVHPGQLGNLMGLSRGPVQQFGMGAAGAMPPGEMARQTAIEAGKAIADKIAQEPQATGGGGAGQDPNRGFDWESLMMGLASGGRGLGALARLMRPRLIHHGFVGRPLNIPR